MLVREAIARQARTSPAVAGAASERRLPAAFPGNEPAHAQFAVPSGPDGSCIIEPSVTCNHCGYCKSYGH